MRLFKGKASGPSPQSSNVVAPGGNVPLAPPNASIPQTPNSSVPPKAKKAGRLSRFKEFFRNLSRKKKLAFIGVVAIILLGGSAAAYYVITNNNPKKVLVQGVENTLGQTQIHFEGKVSTIPVSGDSDFNSDTTIKGQADTAAKSLQAEVGVTISGVSVSTEVIFVDGTLYIKIGDLSEVVSFVKLNDPDLGKAIEASADKIANQWIEVDNTLIRQYSSGSDCQTSPTGLTFTADDISKIIDQYKDSPFVTITSTSDDMVNGNAATKFELDIDHARGLSYLRNLNVGPLKKISECEDSFDTSNITGSTPLTVWIDQQNRQIVKVAAHGTEENQNVSGEINFSYSPVSITKPEGAKSLVELLGSLSESTDSGITPFFPLLNGLDSSSI